MEQAPNEEVIKKIIEKFLENMGFTGSVVVDGIQEDTCFARILTSESGFLIGSKGEALHDLQTVLNKILKKTTKSDIFIDLDVNDYKEKKVKRLKEIANKYADEVALFHRAKEIPGLSPFERRIIHTALKMRHDVATESVGEGTDRTLVIKPFLS